MLIRKKDEYVVNGLGKVSVYTALDPKQAEAEKEPAVTYEGFAILGAPAGGGQIMQVPVEFILDVSSIDEAFQKFQAAATEQFKRMMTQAREQAEAEQRKIITAPAGSIR